MLSYPSSSVVVSLLFLFLSFSFPSATAINTYLNANTEKCFFEVATKGEKVYGSFSVTSGGQLDIDVRVLDPSNKVVFQADRASDNSFQFFAQLDGIYQLCLSNLMSAISGKYVSFHVYIGSAMAPREAAKHEHISSVDTQVQQLTQGLNYVRDTNEYFRLREQRHSQTTESTNYRVFWFSVLKFVALVTVSALSIILLLRLFENKRRGV